VQRALVAELDASYLFVQGPPGTGKTWRGARLITELMRHGRRVGVATANHKAIHNLLAEVEKAAREEGLRFRDLKKASGGNDESFYQGGSITYAPEVATHARAAPDVLLFAGTEVPVLEHLLGAHPTIPPDLGVFLSRTRRMHPDVCRFISEVVYEGRLE